MDLAGTGAAGGRTGVIWTLLESDDLNANLVRFGAGGGVGEQINDEVDVIFVGISGTGSVLTNGEERRLSAGTLVFVQQRCEEVDPRPFRGLLIPHDPPAAGSAADRAGGTMKQENVSK